VLLTLVALLLVVERQAQRRLRFATSAPGPRPWQRCPALRARGAAAAGCSCCAALPVLLGFVLPVLWLVRMLWQEAQLAEFGLPLAASCNGPGQLPAGGGAALAGHAAGAGAGLHAAPAGRQAAARLARLLSLGYAVPGAVIAIGILLPMGWVQARWPALGLPALVTGTLAGVLYAYLVRFSRSPCSRWRRVMHACRPAWTRRPGCSARALAGLRELHLPLLRRSAAAAVLLVFVDVMKELPATLVLRPFGSDTLAVVAYNFARDERLGEAALPSLAIVAVGLIPVILLSRAMRAGAPPAAP
jgi:iron(III) transport system permease protein